ncbi:MAG: hypothetical protein ABIQ35_07035, partial [Verrucomicrobiota bacterium]
MNRTSVQCSLGLVLAAVALCSGTSQAQVTLDPAWRVTPDTTKPGFQWRYFQNNVTRPNTDSRTETALAGLLTDGTGALLDNLGDPNAIGAASAAAVPANPANGSLYFEITNVINLDKTGFGNNGFFPGDELEPGTTDGNTDGQNAEILTYITLPAGTNFMNMVADDSTKVQVGPNPQDVFGRVTLALRQGGAGEMPFSFIVPAGGAGTYPFRALWANGSGGSHVEWFATDSTFTNTRVLINDIAGGGLPAYRSAVGAVNPYVKVVSPEPVPRQTERSSRSVTVVLGDGSTAVNTNNITLSIDGNPATLTVSKIGSLVTVDTGVLPGMHVTGEGHTAMLTFRNETGTILRTNQWAFRNLENLLLPSSKVAGENFDSYAEATSPATTLPPGWTATNHTWLEVTPPAGFGVWDLSDVANDPFVNWVMITTTTVFPLEDEVLDNYKAQTINGNPLIDANNWMSNNLIFAASDGRARRVSIGGVNQPNDYAPQIQIAISAPFNLSTVTNPVLTFSSGSRLSGNHEQNALEYSTNNGVTWLPALILQNSATHFLNSDGSYDAVKMMTNVWADVAKFPVIQDPTTRDFISVGSLGQKFGDVLATPISSALAPFIAERNDQVAARKVEAIRLPDASKKSQVRLRFTHYGSCGWEWGLDNIAFYDIAPSSPAPIIASVSATGGVVTIKWNNGGVLESSPSLSNPVWTSTGNMLGTFSEAVAPGA